jgi:thiol-disulfide isomerase/thioredoxin
MIRWSRTAAVLLPLVLAGAGTAVEDGAVTVERPRLGEFIPNSPPVPAPPISLVDLAGNTVSLSEFAGRLVLINLWATWCEPCLREMPSLERMQSRLGDKITVVAISEDRGGSKTVEPFINKLGLKLFKTYLDPKSDAGRAFKVAGLPTSFLIDREGRVLGRVEGAADWDSPKLLEVLKSFLGGGEVIKASFHRVRASGRLRPAAAHSRRSNGRPRDRSACRPGRRRP